MSAAIFSSRSILVAGPVWNVEKPKLIGLASLTANILCRQHNSELSPVDAAAARAMDSLGKFLVVQEQRSRLQPKKWPFLYTFHINGPLFERFFLKTIINLTVAKDPGYSLAGGPQYDFPPLGLVQAAFGRSVLSPPAGLYFHGDVGDRMVSARQGLEILTLVGTNNECVAAATLFRGFPFFLWLAEKVGPWDCADFPLKSLLHRPRSLRGTAHGHRSHEVVFEGW